MIHRFRIIAAACVATCCFAASEVRAQGIPVIDIANLLQTIQQVSDDITQIDNQIQQIRQLETQIASINGIRNLGAVLDNPVLSNYVPANAFTVVNAIDTSGYAALSATGKTLRDASMVYNCMDLSGASRTGCQAKLAQPYQHKGLLQDAMKTASGRLTQIRSLMGQINATTDQKSIQEIQARIGAENAMLAHEASQVQMLQGMADSDERIARSRDQEQQQAMLVRTGKISDFLH